MLTRSEWLRFVAAPFGAVLAADQLSKAWAFQLAAPRSYGLLSIMKLENTGFMLGGLRDVSPLYTVVVPTTVGGLLIFTFMLIQLVLPIRSPTFRAGLSIFLAGILGNVIDRMMFGSVRDFLILAAGGYKTGVFNIGDALQWFGLALFLASWTAHGNVLYPVTERRGRKWIDPKFQLRYCAILVGSGLAFAVLAGMLSYSFLSVTIARLVNVSIADTHRIVTSFWAFYSAATVVFLVMPTGLGVLMSHRVVGPIRAFERYLRDLVDGRTRTFRVRENDEFRHLETVADVLQHFFHDRLGLPPPPIRAGDTAPTFQATTSDGQAVSMADFAGQRMWFIFYRYATCPLCAANLHEIRDVIARAKRAGMAVLIVYESTQADFEAARGRIGQILRAVDVTMICDPERRIYKNYALTPSNAAILHPGTIKGLLKALFSGFRQGRVRGTAGQLPAHFVIGPDGVVEYAFHGRHLADQVSIDGILEFIRPLEAQLVLKSS